MRQRLDVPVSVLFRSEPEGDAQPWRIRWGGADGEKVLRVHKHERARRDGVLYHAWVVGTATSTLRLEWNMNTLGWVIVEINDDVPT